MTRPSTWLRIALASTLLVGLAGAGSAAAVFRPTTWPLTPPPRSVQSDLHVINADGTARRLLTADRRDDGSPSWSPKGGLIAFDVQSVAGQDVFVMKPDGEGLRNLTGRNQAVNAEPAWSPDGRQLVFLSSRAGYYDLFVMNANGTGARRLTQTVNLKHGPAWSPDGTRIAFTGEAEGRGPFDIFIVNADGSGQVNLTNDPARWDSDPAWSPDGRRIAFSSSGDIFVMNADGTGKRNLTNDVAHQEIHPAWSPKTRKIVFARGVPGRVYDLFVMDLDGGGLKRLTGDDTQQESQPSWSPDGKRIVFASHGRVCRVPAVVGRPVTEARSAIRQAFCSVGRVRRVRSRRRGRVIRQHPPAGTSGPVGLKVDLVAGRL